MRELVQELTLRVTTRDLMDVKDAYNLYDTRSAIKFLFDKQYPNKELLLDKGFQTDPDPVNPDVVIITLKAREL